MPDSSNTGWPPMSDLPEREKSLPTCVITGRIAGDLFACGDCDPCALGASFVPDEVKRLLAERDEWMRRYERLASETDARCVCHGTGTVIDEGENAP